MTYYCENCCEFIDESKLDWRPSELEDGRRPWEKVAMCPACGSEELTEAAFCERCGAPIPPDEHLCECCEDDLYRSVQSIVESYVGDVAEAKDKFLDYMERRWF